ncbi:MAG: type II secretion system F family protein [Abitibacteriaceae bacterium]|nr:type II secretion system F family protein [Abditibacteriaceae bacterium]MBV9867568.1 type II secretion system F family protein [Abditibacteriaceae bacterium]
MAETTESATFSPRPQSSRRGGKKRHTPLDRVLSAGDKRESSFASRMWRAIADTLTGSSNALLRNVNQDDIRYRLLRAGFPYGMRARDFLAFKMMMMGLCPVLFVLCLPILDYIFTLLGIDWNVNFVWWLGAILIGAFYGFKFPDIWLSILTRQRQLSIQLALPDMIDLIAVSVEAGLGLYAGIQRVSMRFDNALSEEFLRMIHEVRLGRSRADAMRDLARRVDLDDLTTFTTSLVQAELLGLAVANVLRVQSVRLREKRSQRAREQAQKAPVKMIFPLVFFIFPALFVVILGPAAIRVIATRF